MTTKRMKNVVLERPVIIGTVSTWLGGRAEEDKTHKWTAYVRGPRDEDLSYFIKKVVFHLHPSFKNPKRVVEAPPFEIQEEGWGEFEISYSLYFTDATEKPVDLFHLLKLWPPEGQQQKTKRAIVSETYDVIMFTDPTEAFYKKLIQNEVAPTSLPLPVTFDQYSNATLSEQTELKRISDTRERIKMEIKKLKEEYERSEQDTVKITQEITLLTT
eukprot:TRINITY_DN8178_c0_g3_i2.p1 TRINITY_DN8178_c0_g3~~TRINITY_DN8178_c0_g3_i2.p1  ORF type:complete len:215 (+),score=48.39 TRINITY_DN8178_c0_g3_i2:294-938(+)